jgi:hypothetical protein
VVRVGASGSVTTDPGSTKTVRFVPQLDNDGTCPGCAVTVSSGTLVLQNGDAGSTTGNYSVAGGATLEVDSGTFEAPSVTGSGTVLVAGGSHLTVGSTDTFTAGGLTISGGGAPTATLDKNVSVATFTAGTGNRDGTGTLTVTGTADFTGNFTLGGGTTTIANTVTSSTIATGEVALNGATLTLDAPTDRTTNGPIQLGGNPSTLNINSSFDITGANAPITGNASSVVNIGSAGAITAEPGTGHETDIFVPVNNEGTVTAHTGTLALLEGSTGTNSGGYVMDGGATLWLEGTTPFNSPSITGAGTLWIYGPSVTVGSTDTFSPSNLQIGSGGVLTLNRDASIVNLLDSGGGVRNGSGMLTITGSADFSAGELQLTGGTTTIASSTSPVSFTSGGGLTMSGATLSLDTPTTLTSNNIGLGGSSTINVNSTFSIPSPQTTGFGPDSVLHVGSTGSLTVDPGSGHSFTTETQVHNDGTITVASGTLSTAGFTQSGGTTAVASGAELDGSVTLTGGTLKGNGTLGGPVVSTGGTLAPGASPGTLTINGAYTQGPGGTLAEEITGTTPGTQFDQLLVAGPVTLDGTLAIDSTSFAPASTETFKVISGASSRTGTFAVATGATVNGATYSARYDKDGVTLLVSGPPPPPNQTLSLAFAGTGAGSVSDGASLSCASNCPHQYRQSTVVTLTATPASGSTFAGWSGAGCSGTGSCQITMNVAQSVTATFNAVPPSTHTLTVTRTGTGSGTVTSSPAGINCGATCSSAYNQGTSVTLTAAATNGSTFTGWSGACSGTVTCILSITQNLSATAIFDFSPVVVTPPVVSSADLFCGVQHRGKCVGLKLKTTFSSPGNANWQFAAYNPSPGHATAAAVSKAIGLGSITRRITKAGQQTIVFKLPAGARTNELHKMVVKLKLKSIRVTLTFTDSAGRNNVTVRRIRLRL